MTKLRVLFAGLVFFGSTWAWADTPMGKLGEQPFYLSDLTLKEQLRLYQEASRLERLWRQYAERYAFDQLLEKKAKAEGIDKDEYLRTKVFHDLPTVTDAQVDRYLEQNPQISRRFQGTPEVLRLRVQQGLLEEEKNQRLATFREAWFAESGVLLEPLFGGIAPPRLQVPARPDDQSVGPSSARLDVVVFLDFECPYCRVMFPVLLDLQRRYPEEVRLVFKHLPLPIHEHAVQWAIGVECAGRQGRFVDFAKEVYSRSTVGRSAAEVAQQLELDRAAYDACLGDESVKAKVSADQALAEELGITATPTIVIGDTPLVGQVSPAELQAIVNGKLATVSAGSSPAK